MYYTRVMARRRCSLKRIVPLLILGTVALFGLLQIGAMYAVVSQTFRQKEEQELLGRMEQFLVLLDREITGLANLAKSYAEWDDMYDFVLDPNQDFVEDYFYQEFLDSQDIDGVLIVNTSGRIVWATLAGSQGGPTNVPDLPVLDLFQVPFFTSFDQRIFPKDFSTLPPTYIQGLTSGPATIAAYVSWPINNNTITAEPRGVLVFLRILEGEFLDNLIPGERLSVRYIPYNEQDMLRSLENRVFMGESTLSVYHSTRDVEEKPLGFWLLTMKQEWPQESLRLAAYMALLVALSGIGMYIITLIISQRRLIDPLSRIRDYLNAFSESNESPVIEHDLPIRFRDELGDLAEHIKNLTVRVKKQTTELDILAGTDGLTGLANRRKLQNYLEREVQRNKKVQTTQEERAKDKQGFLGCIIIDIDYFKLYNDHYGHAAGDRVLKEVAQTLQKSAERSGDLVCRYGGEEFIILLPNTDGEGAYSVALRMQKTISNLAIEHAAAPGPPFLSISAGVSASMEHQELNPEQLIAMADQALYQAKRAGRNRVYRSDIP